MKARIFIVLTLSLSCLFSCTNKKETLEARQVFRYNESKGITSLDPVYARNQTIIWPVSQLFNGLVQLDEQLDVVPSIARTWELSDDGKLYTFWLRRDVFFHSSSCFEESTRQVVASDFVYSFNRIIDKEVASPGAWVFDYVEDSDSFIALNDTVLQIRLKKAFPPFLSILAMPYCYVVPKEVVNDESIDFAKEPIGTGPFIWKHWTPDEKLVLLKNENYFETDEEDCSLPYLDAIAITFIKDKQSEFLEFLKGNLDFLSGVNAAYKDELLTRSGQLNPKYQERFQLLTTPYLNTEYLGILMEPSNGDTSLLLDRRIRQAINYGFDRAAMMKYLRNNLGYPATAGMIPPVLPGCLNYGEGYTYQPDLARQFIQEYRDTETDLNIVLTTTSDYLDLCEYIQFELGELGLDIEINVNTGASFRNKVANANLEFFRASWIADYADAENYLALFYSKNHTPQGPNYTRFSSSEFDRLYEKAISEAAIENRVDLYRKMDSIIISEAPVVPLFYDMVARFIPLNVKGFSPNAMNNLHLKNVRKE